jgi:hypothetical protein
MTIEAIPEERAKLVSPGPLPVPEDITISESELRLLTQCREYLESELYPGRPESLRLTAAALICDIELRIDQLRFPESPMPDSAPFRWPVDDSKASELVEKLRIRRLAARAATAWLARATRAVDDMSFCGPSILGAAGLMLGLKEGE